MLEMEGLDVNNEAQLMIGGCAASDLAKIYGTPLYVMDEEAIRSRCRLYMGKMRELYGDNFNVIYASKAFLCKEICRVMNSEGMCIDVVSGGELYTALKSGFPAEKIYFHGNNKSYEELEMAVQNSVGTIVVDNKSEIEILSKIAGKLGKSVNVLIRIKPGVDAHTHKFIKTGQIDSKFGFALENDEALNIVLNTVKEKTLKLKGLHCHIGSQILNSLPFVKAAEIMLDFIYRLKRDFSIDIRELNLGGGFGINYLPHEKPMDPLKTLKDVHEALLKRANKFNIMLPKISIEPGRSVVGEAGVTLYRVGNIKEIKNVRTYIAVDGGMADNPRYILYGAPYEIVNADRMNAKRDCLVTVAGKCCESGDLIQKDVKICKTEVGDILAVLCTGAYNYSMASNYNRIAKPAVVMVKNGTHRLIVRRQTLEELIAQDV